MARKKMNAAERIAALVERAKLNGRARITLKRNHRLGFSREVVECYLSGTVYRNGQYVGRRLFFSLNGNRISRSKLLGIMMDWLE